MNRKFDVMMKSQGINKGTAVSFVQILKDFIHFVVLVGAFYMFQSTTHQRAHTNSLNYGPAGVLPGEAEMSLLLSLSGVSASSPPGGIPSLLILLVVELTAWRSAPLDLSTVIILTSTLLQLHLSTFLTVSLPPALFSFVFFTHPPE